MWGNKMKKDILADRIAAYSFIRIIFKDLDCDDDSIFNKQLAELLKIPLDDLTTLSEGNGDPTSVLVCSLKRRFDSDKDLFTSFGIHNYLVVPFD